MVALSTVPLFPSSCFTSGLRLSGLKWKLLHYDFCDNASALINSLDRGCLSPDQILPHQKELTHKGKQEEGAFQTTFSLRQPGEQHTPWLECATTDQFEICNRKSQIFLLVIFTALKVCNAVIASGFQVVLALLCRTVAHSHLIS